MGVSNRSHARDTHNDVSHAMGAQQHFWARKDLINSTLAGEAYPWYASIDKHLDKMMADTQFMELEASACSDAIEHAVTSRRPLPRYIVTDFSTHMLRLATFYVFPTYVSDMILQLAMMPGYVG